MSVHHRESLSSQWPRRNYGAEARRPSSSAHATKKKLLLLPLEFSPHKSLR
jgi:hypothetical protein